MGIPEIISKNIDDIESLLPKIDEKIRKRRKRTMITAASIASIAVSFFLYKSVLVPQYEAFQKRRQIKVTDIQFEDYRSQLTSILNDNIVEPGEYTRLIVIKKALPGLEKKYKPLGVERDFNSLEKKISNGEQIYKKELERKKQVALVDEEFNHYKNISENVLVGGIDKIKRGQLDGLITHLKRLAERYSSLNANDGIRLTNKLESEVNLAIFKFDLNERFEKEKFRYISLAKNGFSISEEKPLMQIFHRLNSLELGYAEAGLNTNPLYDLLGNVKKSIKKARLGKIYVVTNPSNAKVRVLNLKPKFYQGIKLDPGRYHIEVSAPRYKTEKRWVVVDAGEDENFSFNLEKLVTVSLESKSRQMPKSDIRTYVPRENVKKTSREAKRRRQWADKLESEFYSTYKLYEKALRRQKHSLYRKENLANDFRRLYQKFDRLSRKYKRFEEVYGKVPGTTISRDYAEECRELGNFYKRN